MDNTTISLTEEEQEIFLAVDAHLETGKQYSSRDVLLYHTKMAQDFAQTRNKNKQITIRLSDRDIVAIKALAKQKGMPYQTYITTIIHEKIAA